MLVSLFAVKIFFCSCAQTTGIHTLSLHDALPISPPSSVASAAHSGSQAKTSSASAPAGRRSTATPSASPAVRRDWRRTEEHTSELQSHSDPVFRLLLEKNKNLRHRTWRSAVHAFT